MKISMKKRTWKSLVRSNEWGVLLESWTNEDGEEEWELSEAVTVSPPTSLNKSPIVRSGPPIPLIFISLSSFVLFSIL